MIHVFTTKNKNHDSILETKHLPFKTRFLEIGLNMKSSDLNHLIKIYRLKYEPFNFYSNN
jgi:hypothetical protein